MSVWAAASPAWATAVKRRTLPAAPPLPKPRKRPVHLSAGGSTSEQRMKEPVPGRST